MLNSVTVKDDFLFAADLFITNRCNLHCKYCFHQQDNSTLTLEQAKKTLDELRASDKIKDQFTLNFFGGEPLLYPELVRAIIEYGNATWKDRQLKYFISTNGTYWNEEFYRFLKANKVMVQISVDGTWEHQENNRGQATKVLENIKKIAEILSVTGRLTYSPENINDLAINCEFLYSLGVKRFMHHNIMEVEWTEDDITNYIREFWKLINLRDKYRDLEVHFIEYPLSILRGKEASTDEHCGSGKGLIAIQTDGSIYPCHRAASNRIYKLGDLKGFNRGVFKQVRKSSVEKCKTCEASRICHSCILCNMAINGAFSEPLDWQCKINRAEFKILSQVAERMSLTNINSTITYLAEVTYQSARLLNSVNQRLKNLEEKIK